MVWLYSFFDFGARCGWVVSTTLRLLYSWERPSAHCTGGRVSTRVSLARCQQSHPSLAFSPWTVRPVASRCSDCIVVAHGVITVGAGSQWHVGLVLRVEFSCVPFFCCQFRQKNGTLTESTILLFCWLQSCLCISPLSRSSHHVTGKFLEVLEPSILHELALQHLCFVLERIPEKYATAESSDIFSYTTTPIQTGSGAHPASCTMGTGSLRGVQQLACGVDHPPAFSAEFKRYSCTSDIAWALVASSRVDFTFTYINLHYCILFLKDITDMLHLLVF